MPNLTPLITHTPNAQPLFASAVAAGTAIETAEAFIATGGATAGVTGYFEARGDGLPAGSTHYQWATADGRTQWAVGLDQTQAPSNVGNNLVFFGYDNSGAFLGAPLQIERATGHVSVGEADDSSGGTLLIKGIGGPSRVFDALYNPPVIGGDILLFSQGADGTIAVNTQFTPTVTGTYVVSATVRGVGSGWSWAAGNSINYAMTYNAGANVVTGAQIYIAGLVNPTGMAARGPLAADTFEYQTDILVSLEAGVEYAIARGTTGAAYNTGVGSGIAVTVANLNF